MTVSAAQRMGRESVSPSRRGACPSLSAPMATGDGLLVRLRPAAPGLLLRELAHIAGLAGRYGNGIVEVTARGNLQIRGLTPDTVSPLAAGLETAGIALTQGLAIEMPPLAGLDPSELADPLRIAGALREAVKACEPPLLLAPKLSVIIDGGGRMHLGGTSADLRAQAVVYQDRIVWQISIGGTESTATPVGMADEDEVVAALMTILSALADLGSDARGRNLDTDVFRQTMPLRPSLSQRAAAPVPAGLHDFGDAGMVLGLGLAFGQTGSENIRQMLADPAFSGASEIRLSPGHGLLVAGLARGEIVAAQAAALAAGFCIHADDPGNHIAACAGRGACRSAMIDTKAAARMVIRQAPALFDGSMTVHVSGCVKGCARPSAAMLTFTGVSGGYGLVVNGPASAPPVGYITENTMESALVRLQALVANEKHAGESACSCLTRLGAETIATAVQQG